MTLKSPWAVRRKAGMAIPGSKYPGKTNAWSKVIRGGKRHFELLSQSLISWKETSTWGTSPVLWLIRQLSPGCEVDEISVVPFLHPISTLLSPSSPLVSGDSPFYSPLSSEKAPIVIIYPNGELPLSGENFIFYFGFNYELITFAPC